MLLLLVGLGIWVALQYIPHFVMSYGQGNQVFS
jgi:hypothetical protein